MHAETYILRPPDNLEADPFSLKLLLGTLKVVIKYMIPFSIKASPENGNFYTKQTNIG